MIHHKQIHLTGQIRRFRQSFLQLPELSFKGLFSGDILRRVVEQASSLRDVIYTPLVTLELFLRQALSEDRSCKHIVASFLSERLRAGHKAVSVNTGPYCKARGRLPLEPLQELVRNSGEAVDRQSATGWLWRGRRVKIVDGSTVLLADTPENQQAYPQQQNQKPGLGFPIIRVVGLISLGVGTVLDYALGTYQGKGNGELSLFARLMDGLLHGDLLLADRYYASYATLAKLHACGVAALMRQHAQRKPDFRTGRRLGARDHIICWDKPKVTPAWMSAEEYAALPDELEVREFRVGGVVYVTTLPDAKAYPKDELARLYRERWNIELDLRSIKTHMGMEMLRCQTPEMVEKEIAVNLLAYNLIRAQIAQAARLHAKKPRQLSFKSSVQLFLQAAVRWVSVPIKPLRKMIEALLLAIASTPVGIIKKKPQPRAVKRRPKAYPLLMQPRAILRILRERLERKLKKKMQYQ